MNIRTSMLLVFVLSSGVMHSWSFGNDRNQFPDNVKADKLIYHSPMNGKESVDGWRMEGPGKIWFENGWMHMKSPNQEGHHVFWNPHRLPENFIAQWEAQNMNTNAGLCIIFFAATGLDGQNVFSDDLPDRDGTFRQYHSGALQNYHISYYANTPIVPDRRQSNLRKNPGFNLVQEGEEGIPTKSEAIHTITLVKNGGHIRMWIDNRKVIDWTDKGEAADKPHSDGYIALRQMRWSHFRYRELRIWKLKSP